MKSAVYSLNKMYDLEISTFLQQNISNDKILQTIQQTTVTGT